jgi:predicted DNA-binding protein
MVTRSIVFTDEMYKKLQTIADEVGIPVSTVVKMACSEYLKNKEREEK